MNLYELMKMMYARVQALDPKNVSKIIGYFLLQDEAEQEMFRLALGSDALLISLVDKAKQHLGIANEAHVPFSWPAADQQHHLVVPSTLQFKHHQAHLRDSLVNLQGTAPYHQHAVINHHQMQDSYHQQPFLSTGLFPNDHFYPETFAFLNRSRLKQQLYMLDDQDLATSSSEHGSPNSSNSNSSGSNNAWKPCVYYSRGHCKHGSGCRFLHTPNSISESQPESCLERLELEIQELLRCRRSPIPVLSLPQLYFEEFGRPLHSEECGASSLMNLLSQLKNTVLIDQPSGQKALVLIEDHRTDAQDRNGNNSSARQIYMTFPAESTFTEEDVNVHFSSYGPVQDVRIPYQQKRMFGFVTFQYSDTVKTILAESSPHYICQARVLVKPYRDKVKHSDKKNGDPSRRYQNGTDSVVDNFFALKLHQKSASLIANDFAQTFPIQDNTA